jgi:hypothetical protein
MIAMSTTSIVKMQLQERGPIQGWTSRSYGNSPVERNRNAAESILALEVQGIPQLVSESGLP